jgi:hypothetical protein
MDSDSEEEIDLTNAGLQLDMTVVQQKSAAIQAIGEFANACPMKFAKHFETTVNVLEELFQHYS